MLNNLFILIILFSTLTSCKEKTYTGPSSVADPCFKNGVDTCKAVKNLININLTDEKQTIENFGASDCWTTKFIGKWANADKKNQIADYLFSTDTLANGSPKGIGLSTWRFNIGSGSFEQGAESLISDEYRREECFQNPDGTYNWNKHEGQRWFMEAAKKRGVKEFLGFSLCPPAHLSQNGKGFGLGNTQFNIKSGKEADYADFLVNVVEHFNKNGFAMKYLSPFNEPQWNWGGTSASQEGTGATNAQIANFVKILGPKLKEKNSTTTIALGEAAQWNHIYSAYENRGNQLTDFFSPNSVNYIGNVPNLESVYSAHSYFTTCTNNLIPFRQSALSAKNQIVPKFRLWQTEFGILGNVCNGQYNGSPKNVTIDYGLYVAKVLHHDLAIANVSAWHWWLSVSPYNYSDALVYINDNSGGFDLNSTKTDGIVSDSKQLWCFGNYSRFIRPGMVRVDANLSTITDINLAANTQMVTAYKEVASKKIIIVLVNLENDAKSYSLNLPLANNTILTYSTTAFDNLKKGTITNGVINLPAKSVVTLIASYK
jgi:O-glycosyl hydrolase